MSLTMYVRRHVVADFTSNMCAVFIRADAAPA
jgi:hypothetical protein